LSPEARPLAERWGLAIADGPTPTDQPADPASAPSPGTVLAVESGLGLVVATGGCPLLIRSAQREGKAPATGQTLIQQLGIKPGERLGEGPG